MLRVLTDKGVNSQRKYIQTGAASGLSRLNKTDQLGGTRNTVGDSRTEMLHIT